VRSTSDAPLCAARLCPCVVGHELTHHEPRGSAFQEGTHGLDDVGRGGKGDHCTWPLWRPGLGQPASGPEHFHAFSRVAAASWPRDLRHVRGRARPHSRVGPPPDHPVVKCLFGVHHAVGVTQLRGPRGPPASAGPGVCPTVRAQRELPGAERDFAPSPATTISATYSRPQPPPPRGAVTARRRSGSARVRLRTALVIPRQHLIEQAGHPPPAPRRTAPPYHRRGRSAGPSRRSPSPVSGAAAMTALR